LLAHLHNTTFSINSADHHAQEFYGSREKRHIDEFSECCPFICVRDNRPCLSEHGKFVQDGHKWTDSNDACIHNICDNGTIHSQAFLCAAISCAIEDRITLPGECCPICDPTKSTFCPEEEHQECDIACRFGFVVDPRGCDLCECVRKSQTSTTTTTEITTSSSTSTTTEATAALPPEHHTINPHIHDVHSHAFDFAEHSMMIYIALAGAACAFLLSGLIWYAHRRIYKRVPAMEWQNQLI